MKRLLVLILPVLLLTACPSEKEVTAMMDDLSDKRTLAIKAIDAQTWALDDLLVAHDYFFNFSERVHLLKEEPEAVKNLQKFIKKKGAKIFCESFLIPINRWQVIEGHCASGEFYKCSPEIQEYSNIRQKMMELVGTDTSKILNNEQSCN